MSTAIQWTDETWNPVVGCERVSPGCAHCYAKELHDKRHKAFVAGKAVAPQYAEPFETVQLKPERLDYPLRWRKPKRIFVNSVSDLFHDDVPDEFIAQVFAMMALASWHTFQVLTKRAARMRSLVNSKEFRELVAAFVSHFALEHSDPQNRRRDDLRATAPDVEYDDAAWPLPNVWLGVSVENQRFADERIPLLAETFAAIRFLSCEPLLGPVYIDFDDIANRSWDGRRIDWCIIGAESGKDARTFCVRWAASLMRQCFAAGVCRFLKQLGARPVVTDLTGWRCAAEVAPDLSGYALKLRDRHGGDPDEWPHELRVREFPDELRATNHPQTNRAFP